MDIGPYHLEIARDFGPRVTSLRLGDGPELLARLGPEAVLSHDGGEYAFRGGHRLWAAPEIPEITYASDDHACDVSEEDGTLVVSAPADPAGIVKRLEVSLDDDHLVVEHKLSRDQGDGPEVAPWGITQFPLGGAAIMPLVGVETAPLPNRYLVLWPYSSAQDPRLTFRDDVLVLDAGEGAPIKFGVGPTPGRLGYLRDGWLFIKQVEAADGRVVPDFGAVGQVFVGMGFCELESVGGLTDISDGQTAVLRERWLVTECGDLESAIGLTVG